MSIGMTQSTPPEPTWDDVYAAIGREVWRLAPQDFQDAHHRDLTFLTCWQNIMEAVQNGIYAVAVLPDEEPAVQGEPC